MRRTTRRNAVPFVLGMILLASSCRDVARSILAPRTPPNRSADASPSGFAVTGGGRIDKPYPSTDKSTPNSRDFATFGFDARQLDPATNVGSGNITFVDHNPLAPGGGFTRGYAASSCSGRLDGLPGGPPAGPRGRQR